MGKQMGHPLLNQQSPLKAGLALAAASGTTAACLIVDGKSEGDKPQDAQNDYNGARCFLIHDVAFPCFGSINLRRQRKRSIGKMKKFRGLALKPTLTVPVEGSVPAADQTQLRPGGA
jgi:hypothetical protein